MTEGREASQGWAMEARVRDDKRAQGWLAEWRSSEMGVGCGGWVTKDEHPCFWLDARLNSTANCAGALREFYKLAET